MTDFVDTNLLVYAFDEREQNKRTVSTDFLATPRRAFTISTQVLGEFFVTVTRKLPRALSVSDARIVVQELSRQRVVSVTSALVDSAVKTCHEHQLSYWDALIVEAAASAGCRRILTEDLNHGQTIRGVEIVNPFL